MYCTDYAYRTDGNQTRTIAISSQFGNFGQSMHYFQTLCGSSSFVIVWKPSFWKKPGL